MDTPLTDCIQHYNLVLGDHLYSALDSPLHIPSRSSVHNHLRWYPAEDARCQC